MCNNVFHSVEGFVEEWSGALCHGVLVEVRGQLCGVGSLLLLLCELQGFTSGGQAFVASTFIYLSHLARLYKLCSVFIR